MIEKELENTQSIVVKLRAENHEIHLIAKKVRAFTHLNGLFSAILTYRKFFGIFKEREKAIIKSIISQSYCSEEYHLGLSEIFAALVFVVRHRFVDRDTAQAAFKRCWGHLKDLQFEQLLIPVGRGLASSYVLDDRSFDAICLLTKIHGRSQPFG
ncbi:hypothetical protein BGW36DRAFT_354047 [Talaromyces proteolyticus]|uniref:Uncharacterized protein n=1 Tax=Talaromyces proteolyticus TaxID=1131652 RepID=A0AAD4L845_9EURO|nr:uncharacterized protein BGW36DRAFT_354047 [Talaromyces proteolyticus]KAH8705649.1 hypothetical protein BGW36DRAFT_354047 [Talaromyces proteolyticus]